MLKQLVLLKKENAKVQEEIDYYNKVVEENDDEEEKVVEEENVRLPALGKTVDAKNRVDH